MENLYNPALYEIVGCTFQAYGEGFQPEFFLQDSSFIEQQILLKSALGVPEELRDKVSAIKELSAFLNLPFLVVKISSAFTLQEQIEEATVFLKTHQGDLQKLKIFPCVESILLQFITDDDEASSDTELISDELSNLALENGIEHLSFRKISLPST